MSKLIRAPLLTSWILAALMGIGAFTVPAVFAQDEAADVVEAVAPAAPAETAEPAAGTEPESAYSSEAYVETPGYSTFAVNNLWICISAALVFIMHLGFTTLEAGLTQKKNAVNIIFKKRVDRLHGSAVVRCLGIQRDVPGRGRSRLGRLLRDGQLVWSVAERCQHDDCRIQRWIHLVG